MRVPPDTHSVLLAASGYSQRNWFRARAYSQNPAMRVPPEYVGREVWVRYDGRMIRVFNDRIEQIAIHAKADPGRFQTDGKHLASKKISMVERGAEYMLSKIKWIGPNSNLWAKTMLIERGIPGIRVLQGFLHLAERHADSDLEQVCQIALRHGCYRLKPLRHLLKNGNQQEELEFMQIHPIIRELDDYGQLIKEMIGST